MKKIVFFLLGLFVLTGCSSEEEHELIPSSDLVSEISEDATRTVPDSIAIALDNSMLLRELNAYNDSILSTKVQTRAFGWLKKFFKIATADFCGFATGMVIGSGVTLNPTVGAVVGVIAGTGCSIAAAKGKFPEQIFQKIPEQYNMQFTRFDMCTYEVQTDDNFNNRFAIELNSIDGISEYGNLKTYVNYGVQHNLVVDQFRNGSAPSNPSTTYSALPPFYKALIYGSPVMNTLQEFKSYVLEDNLNWNYLFCNRENMTQTISQAKAAVLANDFVELMENAEPDPEEAAGYTLAYLQSINGTHELESTEKTILLNSIPVFMCSLSYWNRNLQIDIEDDPK